MICRHEGCERTDLCRCGWCKEHTWHHGGRPTMGQIIQKGADTLAKDVDRRILDSLIRRSAKPE